MRPGFGAELRLRILSAIVMGAAAIGTAVWGGWPFAVFWCAAGVAILWEWGRFVSPSLGRNLALIGLAAVIGSAVFAFLGRPSDIVWVAVASLVAAVVVSRGLWGAAGIAYAGGVAAATVLLRSDPIWGLTAIVLTFAVVWSTDSAAYFGGRLIGGPKLWPQVSPKKTWSGALTGTIAAMVAGLAVAVCAGAPRLAPVALVCFAMSVASQLGDLLESSIKRHFGVKDASALIPGHGGVMDRLDGFIFAVALASIVGFVRGGFEGPSRGLLIW